MHRVNRRIQTRGDAAIAAICSRPPASSRSLPARPGSGTQLSSLTRLRRTVGTHSMSAPAACRTAQATALYRSGSVDSGRLQAACPSEFRIPSPRFLKKKKEQHQAHAGAAVLVGSSDRGGSTAHDVAASASSRRVRTGVGGSAGKQLLLAWRCPRADLRPVRHLWSSAACALSRCNAARCLMLGEGAPIVEPIACLHLVPRRSTILFTRCHACFACVT